MNILQLRARAFQSSAMLVAGSIEAADMAQSMTSGPQSIQKRFVWLFVFAVQRFWFAHLTCALRQTRISISPVFVGCVKPGW